MRLENLAGAAVLVVALASTWTPARAADDAWGQGNNWMSVRVGYAKSDAPLSGNGGAGYGIAFSHMLAPTHVARWSVLGVKPLGLLHWTLLRGFSLGGVVQYDVVGRYGAAEEIGIPVSLELVRHFKWKTTARPYLGIGGGPYYRKTYNTGSDQKRVVLGGYLTTGMNAPIAPRQLIGLDVRYAHVPGENKPVNPVFGGGANEAAHWSIKLGYTVAY
jgi:hypothetical protein